MRTTRLAAGTAVVGLATAVAGSTALPGTASAASTRAAASLGARTGSPLHYAVPESDGRYQVSVRLPHTVPADLTVRQQGRRLAVTRTAQTVTFSGTAAAGTLAFDLSRTPRPGTTLAGRTVAVRTVTVRRLALAAAVPVAAAVGVATATPLPTSPGTVDSAPAVHAPVSPGAPASWVSGVWPGGPLDAATTDAFGSYRGARVGIATVYQVRDSWHTIASSTWSVEQYSGWSGRLAIGVPLLPTDGSTTLAQVAAGDHDADFRSFAQMLVAEHREGSVLRLGWEFDGDWQPWAASDPTTYRAAFRRVVGVLRSVIPGATIDWCGNIGPSHVGTPSLQLYPGDDVVDIIGVDAYDTRYNHVHDAASWSYFRTMEGGLDVWHTFAVAHHKLFSVPEWGLDVTGGGDNPYFISQMHAYFTEVAPSLAYEAYFDEAADYIKGSLVGGQNPQAALAYKALWSAAS